MPVRHTIPTFEDLKVAIDRSPLIVTPDLSLMDAIAQMVGTNLACPSDLTAHLRQDQLNLKLRSSCAIVVENERIIGILTKRDVVNLSAQQQFLEHLTVSQGMTSPVITMKSAEFKDLFFTIDLLEYHQIGHLPLVNNQQQLVGLVTRDSLQQIMQFAEVMRLRLVEEEMTRTVIYAEPNCPLIEIIQLMIEHQVDSVVIVHKHKKDKTFLTPIGIITEQDIVRFKALGLNFHTCLARTVMRTSFVTVNFEESLWTVQQLMRQHSCSQVIVTGKHKQLMGIITQNDVLKALTPLELYKFAAILERRIEDLEIDKQTLLESQTSELEKQVSERTAVLLSQVERERLLLNLVLQIRSSLNLHTILNTTVEQVRHLLGCDRVNIWQLEGDEHSFIIAESTCLPVSLLGERIEDIYCQQEQLESYSQGRVRIIPDIYTSEMSESHREMLAHLDIRAQILVPLLCGQELWGLLSVTESRNARNWQWSEIELLQSLSMHLGLALQQATTYDSLQKELAERQQAEANLRENEQRYTSLAAASPVGVFRADVMGNCVYVNERYCRMTKQPITNVMGTEWHNIIHPDDRGRVLGECEASARELRSFQLEYRLLCPDGTFIWVYGQSVPELDDAGNIIGHVGTITDISDRVLAEQKLQQLNQELEIRVKERTRKLEEVSSLQTAILNSINYAVISTDLNGVIQTFNTGAEKMLGYSAAEVVGKTTPELFHDLDEIAERKILLSQELGVILPNNFEVFVAKARHNQANEEEWTYIHKDKSRLPVLLCVTAIRDLNQEIVGFLGIARDISERYQAEEQLRQVSHRLDLALQAGAIGTWDWDLNNSIIWDGRMYELYWLPNLGHSVNYQDWRSRLHPDDIKNAENALQGAIQGIKNYDIEFRILHPQGEMRWIKATALVQRSADGLPMRMIGTNQDITIHKKSEEALSRQLAAIEAAIDGIGILQEGVYIYVNQSHTEMFGYQSSSDLLGKPWCTLYAPEEIERFESEVFPILERERFWQGEAMATHKDGSTFNEGLSLTLLEDGMLICVCRDISERKQAELKLYQTNQELAHATRLKDEFLANMSHELRTPLNAILGMTEGLQDGAFGELSPQQTKALQTVEQSGSHLLELINDILDVAKIESGQMDLNYAPTAIAPLCQSSLAFIKQQAFKKGIRLEMKLPVFVPELLVDERRIRQVLINLLNNAVKFTPQGGSITLEVQDLVYNQEPYPALATKSSAPKFLRIAVTDTGIGIAPEHISKLFKPFVQIDSALNRQYQGTGLGLTVVKHIVELHDGLVGVTSQVGVGSCFTIDLPYVTSPSGLSPVQPQSDVVSNFNLVAQRKSFSILLAEDNDANISTISGYLKAKGYEILIAKNGEEAVQVAKTQHPDLILMDIQMPVMDGLEAIRKIRCEPNISKVPIIALTALAMQGDREKCLEVGANDYLSKPVKLKQLTTTIQQLLMP